MALLALLTASHGAVHAQSETLTVTLTDLNGSGQDGTATITRTGENSVHVVLKLTKGTSEPQPAHIHKGTCEKLDPKPAYPLTNVVNGESVSDVNANIEDLANEGFAINVHKSAAEVGTYVSCGEIHEMSATGGTIVPTTGAAGLAAMEAAAEDLVHETANKDATGSQNAYNKYHDLFAANEGAIKDRNAATQTKLEDLMHEVRDAIAAANWTKAASSAEELEAAVKSAVAMMNSTSTGPATSPPSTTSGGSTTMPTTGNSDLPLFLGGLTLLALALTGAGLRLVRSRS
jgi:hypothetical protein